jgi:hypothetical protein
MDSAKRSRFVIIWIVQNAKYAKYASVCNMHHWQYAIYAKYLILLDRNSPRSAPPGAAAASWPGASPP